MMKKMLAIKQDAFSENSLKQRAGDPNELGMLKCQMADL